MSGKFHITYHTSKNIKGRHIPLKLYSVVPSDFGNSSPPWDIGIPV